MKKTIFWLFIVVLTLSNTVGVVAQSQKCDCDSIFWPDGHGGKDIRNTIIVSTFHEQFGKDAKIECNEDCWLTKITFAGGHHSEEYIYADNGMVIEYIYDSKTHSHYKFYDEAGKETKCIHKILIEDGEDTSVVKYITQITYYKNGSFDYIETDNNGDGVFERLQYGFSKRAGFCSFF